MLAERCSANDAMERQNVVVPPKNKTQQSNGKAAQAERCNAAAEQNTTIKWESCTGRTL
jgi:hypothetical protein